MFDPTRPGPFYEDFQVGATLPALPSVTLTDADNAAYRAITGDQHALAADAWTYDAATGVLRARFDGRKGRLRVEACAAG